MMLIDKSVLGKKNADKYFVGYDLGNLISQISYCSIAEKEPETVAVVAGSQQFNIPTVLSKRQEVNQWYFGKEAVKYHQEKSCVYLDGLLEKARKKESILVEDTEYHPVALLALFMKRSLSLLSLLIPLDKVEAMMITVDDLDYEMMEVLTEVVLQMNLKTKQIYFQSHMESFFHYVIRQPKELWNHQVVAFDFTADYLKSYRLEMNRHTTPMVAFIEKQHIHQINRVIEEQPGEDFGIKDKGLADDLFYKICEETVSGRIVTTVYLVGEGFQGDFTKKSLPFLCNTRRVFGGNNLYSKGACFALWDKLELSESSRAYIFLGEDKLKANLGINLWKRREIIYLPLLDAGVNWYDAKSEVDVTLHQGNTICLLATPLNGKNKREYIMTLDCLPERPEKTTRLRIILDMKSEQIAHITVLDLGFGSVFQSSNLKWEEEFAII